MMHEINERVSALLDNELPADETVELLGYLRECQGLQDTWDRYHLIGDLLRGEAISVWTSEISERVRRELESAPAIIAAPRTETVANDRSRWMWTLVGAGMAASVAALIVFIAPHFLNGNTGDGAQVAEAVTTAPLFYVERSGGTRWQNLSESALESRLNGYLMEHNKYASPSGIGGIFPYATFVSYDASH